MKSTALKVTLLLTTFSLPLQATLLSTAQVGNAPAHCLMKGDAVKSLDKDKATVKKAHVLAAHQSTVNSIIEIDLGNRTIQATEDQTFFDPVLKKWVKAKDVTVTNSLLSEDLSVVPVSGIARKDGEFKAVQVTVDGSHYMFVDGVLTHNFLGLFLLPGIIALTLLNAAQEKGYANKGKRTTGGSGGDSGSGGGAGIKIRW